MNRTIAKGIAVAVLAAVAAYLWLRYGSGTLMGYKFPNGFEDLDNWQNADDGSDSSENRKTRLLIAIAKAEGYGVPNAIPTLANNPGDLTLSLGYKVTGRLLGSAQIQQFVSRDDGWAALQHQIDLILSGKSSVYTSNDTIASLAQKYTATQPDAWAANVSRALGVSSDTPLGVYLA